MIRKTSLTSCRQLSRKSTKHSHQLDPYGDSDAGREEASVRRQAILVLEASVFSNAVNWSADRGRVYRGEIAREVAKHTLLARRNTLFLMLRRSAYLLSLETPFSEMRPYHAPANKLAREGISSKQRVIPSKKCRVSSAGGSCESVDSNWAQARFFAGDFVLLSGQIFCEGLTPLRKFRARAHCRWW